MWHEKQRHLLKKIQDTKNIVHRTMMPQSPSKQAPWDLTQFSQSPSAALSYFSEFHWWSGISSLSKVVLVLGKSRSCRAPNLSSKGAEASLSYIQCFLYLVSSSINVSIFHISWLDTFWTDYIYMQSIYSLSIYVCVYIYICTYIYIRVLR